MIFIQKKKAHVLVGITDTPTLITEPIKRDSSKGTISFYGAPLGIRTPDLRFFEKRHHQSLKFQRFRLKNF